MKILIIKPKKLPLIRIIQPIQQSQYIQIKRLILHVNLIHNLISLILIKHNKIKNYIYIYIFLNISIWRTKILKSILKVLILLIRIYFRCAFPIWILVCSPQKWNNFCKNVRTSKCCSSITANSPPSKTYPSSPN